MRIRAVCAALLAVAVAAPACVFQGVRGSGVVEREEVPIRGVRAVAVENQGDLFIEIGPEESLIIEAEDNLLELLEADLHVDLLRLRTRGRGVQLRPTEPIRYYLTVPALESLRVSSAGSIEAPTLIADEFSLEVASSGDIHIERLEADSLDVRISSSGSVTIGSGQVEEQDLSLSSSGSYNAKDLQSDRARARISSSGNARIRVQDVVDARLSSSGGLSITGDPEVSKRESSSGRVRVRTER